MRLLHIARRYLPCRGGTEKYIHDMANGLMDKGHVSRVLCLDTCVGDSRVHLPRYDEINGILVHRIRGVGPSRKPLPLELPLNDFKQAEVVILHDNRFLFETTLVLKQLYGFKLVYVTHGFILHTERYKALKQVAIRIYYVPIFKEMFDAVICVSNLDYRRFSEWGVPRLHLVENGIDVSSYAPSPAHRPVKGRLLFFGRIDENKGLEFLFRALAVIRDQQWRLHVVGTGSASYLTALHALATGLSIGDRIMWMGVLQDAALREQIVQATACVFPSTYEGFGFTLVEAMATGALCIANEIPTYRDILGDGVCGMIVNVRDTDAFARGIQRAINMQSQDIQKIRDAARLRARRCYDLRSRVDKFNDILIRIYEQHM